MLTNRQKNRRKLFLIKTMKSVAVIQIEDTLFKVMFLTAGMDSLFVFFCFQIIPVFLKKKKHGR